MGKDKLTKEKEEIVSKLKDLSKEPPKFPPSENAMCYCPAPPDFNKKNGRKGSDLRRKILVIIAIIVGAVLANGIAVALVLLYLKQ